MYIIHGDPMFSIIDCNNFYASCERLFRPDLTNKPIIVLSNNDGGVIARSNETKALGISMGEPYFKVKAICKQHHIHVFSSNYTLYGDLSHRVMNVIEENWPHTEVYSIDEAFLDLTTLPACYHDAFSQDLQKLIRKNTGIPTSIGIGPTKTLAKLANNIAKKQLKIPVFNITGQDYWLDQVSIDEVWGVGRKWAIKLAAMNIRTAGDLSRADVSLIKKRFNVILQRTAYELRGIPCLELEEATLKQSIVSSKSFGAPQTELNDLNTAITSHVTRAWEKMRKQGLVAQYLSVFAHSNRFRLDLPQYSKSTGFKLLTATDELSYLTFCAKACMKQIYKEGIQYKKVGVLFDGLKPKNPSQLDMFHVVSEGQNEKTENIMSVFESINNRYGSSTVRLAAEGYSKPWLMNRQMKSPNYTTQWASSQPFTRMTPTP